ncbi:AraC family transcriptional regulator [Lautropia mirabilis]|uniref:helix-turn-helix transcriptional regulator n=1 Tax=Lautropia mirabilis TaxID=47671 RepID=UPI0023552769|nr:AraC family transcriptional regulator [Lautropia mirabilis]
MSSQETGMGHDGMGAPPGPEGLIPQDEAFSSGPLLTHYLQHLLWWFREGVEPVMAVDGHAGRASVGTKTPWLQGHIGVQVFESGILAADATGSLALPYRSRYEEHHYAPHVALTLKMSGGMSWTDLRGHEHHHPGVQELWFQTGMMEWQNSTIHAGPWSYCHVSMQAPVLERWLADDVLADDARRLLEQCLQPRPRGTGAIRISSLPDTMLQPMQQLHALLSTPGMLMAVPLAQQLQVEGLVLMLLGQWLGLPPQPLKRRQGQWRRAVDDAIDIIQAEYGTELSISKLAWRVGTNECYLKQGFRERLGMGVATFLRLQRMKVALALLEEGRHSVKEIAHYVGYRSLGHFSQAFRAVHGHLPSQVRGRNRS